MGLPRSLLEAYYQIAFEIKMSYLGILLILSQVSHDCHSVILYDTGLQMGPYNNGVCLSPGRQSEK